MTRFTVREATAADAGGICRLFARVFGKPMTEEEWLWKFEQNPDGWYGIVAVSGREIVGNYAGWGIRLRLGGRPRLSYAVVDVATDPAVRMLGGRHGVFRSMAEAFYAAVDARDVPFCFGFPSARAQAIGERLLGYWPLFPIRELHFSCDALGGEPEGVLASDRVGESFDVLWEEARKQLPFGAVRDRARVNWRFHGRPNRYYRMVTVRRGGEDQSWAALSIAPGGDALVADCLLRGPEDFPDLFRAAGAEAARLGARALVFWDPPGGPARPALAALHPEHRESGFSLVARITDGQAARLFAEQAQVIPALYDVT
jgi:Acetyltransferase (GNAT) domain